MEVKQKQHVSREELVSQLRKIATMINKGSVKVSDYTVAIPDEVDLELEIEEKKGKFQFEIEVEWKVTEPAGETEEASEEEEGSS